MFAVSHPLLEVRGLSKRFGASPALTEVSLTVRRGEILGLIGPNGSGKTTLLECLAGRLPPDRGQTMSKGWTLTGRDRERTFFTFPTGIVPWEAQPVRWVLRYFEALHGSARGIRESVAKELSLFGLLNQSVGALSRGQRKRLPTALGLLTPHPLLLLDEPFEGLDVRQIREAAGLLRAWAGRRERPVAWEPGRARGGTRRLADRPGRFRAQSCGDAPHDGSGARRSIARGGGRPRRPAPAPAGKEHSRRDAASLPSRAFALCVAAQSGGR